MYNRADWWMNTRRTGADEWIPGGLMDECITGRTDGYMYNWAYWRMNVYSCWLTDICITGRTDRWMYNRADRLINPGRTGGWMNTGRTDGWMYYRANWRMSVYPGELTHVFITGWTDEWITGGLRACCFGIQQFKGWHMSQNGNETTNNITHTHRQGF